MGMVCVRVCDVCAIAVHVPHAASACTQRVRCEFALTRHKERVPPTSHFIGLRLHVESDRCCELTLHEAHHARPKTHPPREKRRFALFIDVTAVVAPWLPSFQVANPVVCATDDELLVRGAHSRRIHVRHAPRALDHDRPPSSSGRTCYCARSP